MNGEELATKRPADPGLALLLFENVGIGIIHVDAEGFLTAMNRKAEEMLLISRVEVLGKSVDMLPLRTPIYKVLGEDSNDVAVEMSFSGMIIAVSSTVINSPEGIPSGKIVELRDISEEKKEKRQREEFVAMMTHDLKSPLTVVMGYLHTLKEELGRKIDDSLSGCIGEMEKSSARMLSMVEDIMDAYRLEVGLLKIDRTQCDIKALLLGCCHDGSQEAVIRGSQFKSSIPEALPMVQADPKQLARVFANLIGNAVKFTPRRGMIEVFAACNEKNLVVEIKDTGIGIPPDEVSRVFNKYFRSSASAGFKGSGLGLTLSKAIVEAHGGVINVTSAEGEGSSFTVLLPLSYA